MSPPLDIPGGGPDQSLFFLLFALGFVVGVLGHMTGSSTVRMVGIMLVMAGSGVFLVDILSEG